MNIQSSTLVVIATYNEIENLPRLADEVFQHAPQTHVLVIDDGSPDGTGQWCDERAAHDGRFHVVHRAGKLGLGTATVAGLRYAIEHGFDYALVMDADFSHPPRYISALLDGMACDAGGDGADVMVGSRYAAGGRIEGWPWYRHWMSRGVNLVRPLDAGAEDARLQRRLPLLPHRTTAADRPVAASVARLFLCRGTAVDVEAIRRPHRRDADRVRRPAARQDQDQRPRGGRGAVDLVPFGNPESLGPLNRCLAAS
jgi:hypothetical protein